MKSCTGGPKNLRRFHQITSQPLGLQIMKIQLFMVYQYTNTLGWSRFDISLSTGLDRTCLHRSVIITR